MARGKDITTIIFKKETGAAISSAPIFLYGCANQFGNTLYLNKIVIAKLTGVYVQISFLI